MSWKRLFIIIGFILLVLFIAFGIYSLFFAPPAKQPGITPGGNNSGNLPNINQGNISVVPGNTNEPVGFPNSQTIDQVASGGLTQVTDYQTDSIVDPKMTGAGIAYYQPNSSRFVNLDADGKTRAISDASFFGVDNVSWSPTKQQAILEYPDGSNIFYDFSTKKQVTLPKELQNFSINSSGTTFSAVWKGDNKDNQWLVTSNLDGSDLKLAEPISGNNAVDLQTAVSPDNKVIALYRQAVGSDQQEVIPIGKNGENFKSFTVDGLKFEGAWSPNGSNLLFNASNAADGFRPRLWITQGSSGNLGYSQTDLQLETWADKCAFNSGGDQVFCAVPQEMPEGAGLYPSLADTVPDVFYRVDLTSGVRVPLAIPVGNQQFYNASSVFLSSDQSVLYFMDRFSKRLHSIKLQ